MMKFALTFGLSLMLSCAAADAPPAPAEREATVNPGETVTITGTVTNEGVECPAIRTAEGTLYTIAGGNRDQLKPGVRVRVTGTIAEMSFCMQGTTISATKVEVIQ